LHQDRREHAGQRQNEGQEDGRLVLEPVELSLTVCDLDAPFSVRNPHSTTPRETLGGIQTLQSG
jgi:hypothetical protein